MRGPAGAMPGMIGCRSAEVSSRNGLRVMRLGSDNRQGYFFLASSAFFARSAFDDLWISMRWARS